MLLCKRYGAGLEEKNQPGVLECLGFSSQVTAKYKGKVEQFSEKILDVLEEVVPLFGFLNAILTNVWIYALMIFGRREVLPPHAITGHIIKCHTDLSVKSHIVPCALLQLLFFAWALQSFQSVALKVFLNYCEHLNSKAVEALGSA